MSERTCSVDGCTRPHRARGFCSTCYNQRQPNRHVKQHLPCTVCGKATIKLKDSRRRAVCSDYCRWFYQSPVLSCLVPESHPAHPRWSTRLLPVLYVAPVVVAKEPCRRRWVSGACARCGNMYIVEDYTGTAGYCSSTCQRRVGKQRYRARKRNAYVANVSPRDIYERDGWQCRLCRKPVLRGEVVPHPLAPVLDHVTPLARGGTHEPANVQCAHFLCNSRKSDRMPGTELALFVA